MFKVGDKVVRVGNFDSHIWINKKYKDINYKHNYYTVSQYIKSNIINFPDMIKLEEVFSEYNYNANCFKLYKEPFVIEKEEDYYKWLANRLK